MAKVAVVATLTNALPLNLRELHHLPESVTCLQVRADLTGDIPACELREHFGGELLYSLRSRRCGGGFAGSRAERRRRILAAAREYDLVELEADSDLSPQLLQGVPPCARVISWQGKAG